MRAWNIAVVVMTLVGRGDAVAAGDPATAVTALPVVARLEPPGGTRFVLRGALGPRLGHRMTRLARAVQQDVTRRFLTDRDHSDLAPVDLCLFSSDRTYRAFVRVAYGDPDEQSALGFYLPSRRLIAANVGRSAGNLRHEMVHALLEDDFPGIPAWLNEGLGSLYGSAARSRKGFRFLVNYRLRHFRAARAAGELPDPEALARSTRREVYGDRSYAYYAAARYLLLHLDRRGELEAFVRAVRQTDLSPEAQLAVLERFVEHERFLKWTAKLRLGRPALPKR